ncbi:MAG TPA: hypothetical protein DCQ31_02115, partial [Bacteroidales bacterium]|nr:hypothetical protein [Bacteroidales bacterium]
MLFVAVFLPMVTFVSCSEELLEDLKKLAIELALKEVLGENATENLNTLFGWQKDNEQLDKIETNISFGSSGNISAPASFDLSAKFPPIGNQGQYGTCVAWAVAYNLKTYLDGLDRNLTTAQLADKANQSSPKDLFWAIPAAQKGKDCNGTGFESAMDVAVSRGIAPLSVVPYTELGNCASSPLSNWNTEAAKYKLDNYRQIGDKYGIDINETKGYLAQGRPVVIGAKLGDNFMSAKDATVLKSDTYGYTGQHAYHAMILCGYDDAKQAFRVVNSWGTTWGDKGYIWVDYNFFKKEFCFAAFVASNKKNTPDNDGDNNVDNDKVKSGFDVVAWELQDKVSTDTEFNPNNSQLKRALKYNVFNSGTSDIPASKDWNILYVLYNAYDAKDYKILIYDYYSDDKGALGDDGELATGPGIASNWYNHINVKSKQSAAQALYGGVNDRFNYDYNMPATINGEYYLVIIADGYDVIKEADETNNYY